MSRVDYIMGELESAINNLATGGEKNRYARLKKYVDLDNAGWWAKRVLREDSNGNGDVK